MPTSRENMEEEKYFVWADARKLNILQKAILKLLGAKIYKGKKFDKR